MEQTPPFEKLLEDLEKKVRQMDSGELSLEEMIKSYESGAKLVKQCRSLLDGLEKKIELLAREDGAESVWTDFDPETGARNRPEEPLAPKRSSDAGDSLPF